MLIIRRLLRLRLCLWCIFITASTIFFMSAMELILGEENSYHILKRSAAKTNLIFQLEDENFFSMKKNITYLSTRLYSKSNYFNKYKSDKNIHKVVIKDEDKFRGVLIMSSLRSGSSFTGELFNQHPDIFYFFEPLFPLHDSCTIDVPKKVDILSGLFMCNLTSSIAIIDQSRNEAKHDLRRKMQKDDHLKRRIINLDTCKTSSVCFRFNTKALCGPDICPGTKNCRECKNYPQKNQVEEKCRNSTLQVIKTVRTCSLDVITKAQDKKPLLLKVLHLIRDPRAIALSRLKMHNGKGNVTREMLVNCDLDLKNILLYKERNQKHKWLYGNYKIIRYEDIILNPLKFINATTDFINKGVNRHPINLNHADVANWLEKNTHISVKSIYSTSRNITEQVNTWRTAIDMNLVLSIQNACAKMMSAFGYLPINEEIQLKNFSFNVIKNMENYL